MYELKSFDNGFEYLEIKNSSCQAKIALQGAHIFEYKQNAKENLLWLSDKSHFEKDKAIRGGIPLCWPRFGNLDKTLPQHGFARIFKFDIVDIEEIDEFLTKIHFRLKDTPQSMKIWNYKFELDLVFELSDSLKISMKTKNLDIKEFSLTQAFHTYFNISNISNIKIEGLQNKPFLDTLKDEIKREKDAIKIDEEIDRVYQEVDKDIILKDKNTELKISSEGCLSAIVWNPWIDKCTRMSAMSKNAYKEFVCIENANAFDDIRVLKAGDSHTISISLMQL
jgi:glucose-6-phosphate 1-epimerase